MVHDRHVPLEGASNMRDLGGLPLAGGARVRRGRAYRSAVLSELTPRDQMRLIDLKIVTIVDLRSDRERANAPSQLPSGLEVLAPGDGGVGAQPGLMFRNPKTAKEAVRMMCEGNRTYPDRLAAATGATFRALAAEKSGGVLFHCTAGKDRTGFIAAMLLLSVGASEETVVEDYLATNLIWDRRNTHIHHLPEPTHEPIFSARSEYLLCALDEVQKTFGSAEAYVGVRCGVDDRTLDRVRTTLIEAG